MHLGLIGAGMVGGTLGVLWARAGHVIHYAVRHPERLGPLLERTPGAVVEPAPAAAAAARALLLAVPYFAMAELAATLRPHLAGKLVLDAGNVIPVRDGRVAAVLREAHTGSGTHTASLLPQARVVKAFNTVFWKTLETQAHRIGPLIGVPLAGDDAQALEEASALVWDAGFEPVVLPGGMAASARLDFGSPVWNANLDAAGIRKALGL